jgi:DNA-binding beta-propeller fold protein YncE
VRAAASAALLTATLAAVALTACGSQEGFPPPAEPAASPAPSSKPAGTTLNLGRGEAEGIAADPATGLVAVGTRDPDRLYLVSAERIALTTDRVAIPESPRHMQLAAPGGPLLTTAEQTDDLIEVSLPSGRTRVTRVGDFPHDATAAADGSIFVADEGGDTISVVEDGVLTDTLPAPEQPGGIAASGENVAVIAVAERVLALYDVASRELIGQVDAGVGPTHIVAGDDGRMYVADTQGDAVLVFDAGGEDGGPRLVDRIGVPGSPYGIAIDNRNDRLWVTRTASNLLTEFELTDLAPKRLRSFVTVQQPNSVAVDPSAGLVYVAGRAEATLQMIDPATDGEAP